MTATAPNINFLLRQTCPTGIKETGITERFNCERMFSTVFCIRGRRKEILSPFFYGDKPAGVLLQKDIYSIRESVIHHLLLSWQKSIYKNSKWVSTPLREAGEIFAILWFLSLPDKALHWFQQAQKISKQPNNHLDQTILEQITPLDHHILIARRHVSHIKLWSWHTVFVRPPDFLGDESELQSVNLNLLPTTSNNII